MIFLETLPINKLVNVLLFYYFFIVKTLGNEFLLKEEKFEEYKFVKCNINFIEENCYKPKVKK